MNVQVHHSSYNDLIYNDKGRFNSYWHQIDSALSFKPKTALEIGTGIGLVKFMLQKNNVHVTIADIDPELKPDVVASVLELPFQENTFDIVMCCQVLEHLEYVNFLPALKEIRRVVKSGLILSLPDLRRVYRLNVQLPKLGEFRFLYSIPRLKPIDWEFNGEHYWNISCKGYPVSRIRKDIECAGFEIQNEYCVFEMAWHRFFILKKK